MGHLHLAIFILIFLSALTSTKRQTNQNNQLERCLEMVRFYKRKTDRNSWPKASLEAALADIKGGCSIRRAAQCYQIPRATLKRHLERENQVKPVGEFTCVFSGEQEAELVKYILDMEQRLFGITARELRKLAFDLAEKNGLSHPFNKAIRLAGRDWLASFRKRHPELSLRAPEATSAARAQGFNRVAVDGFFRLYNEIVIAKKIQPHRIYNVDETSIVPIPSKRSKVLALRGRRQVGCLSSAERGLLTTSCLCMSATGHFIPPDQLKAGAPAGTIFTGNPSGWMTAKAFNMWFKHFIQHTKPTAEDPVLLILDGHSSHTRNLEFVDRARDNHVHVLSLPPHCSHKLQPLDVSFMSPFKTHLSQAIEGYLKGNDGKVVTLNEMSSLLGIAFNRTASVSVAVNGFRATGIVPMNPFRFGDADFAPADVTDIARFADSEDEDCFLGFGVGGKAVTRSSSGPPPSTSSPSELPPSTSSASPFPFGPSTSTASPNSSFTVSPLNIRPLPKSQTRKAPSKRKREKSAIITSSPNRNALKALQANKDIKEIKKQQRAAKRRPETGKAAKRKRVDNSENVPQDTLCCHCGAQFSASVEGAGWSQCIGCQAWNHDCVAGACSCFD